MTKRESIREVKKHPDVEVRRNKEIESSFTLYDVFVNGKREVEGETFGVAHNIKDSFNGLIYGSYLETDEIVDAICKKRGIKHGTR